MIYTHCHVHLERNDGSTVATDLSLNKSGDKLQYTPNGVLLVATVLADPTMDGDECLFKPGDVLRFGGDSSESAYTVINVEDRRHTVIPDVRLLVRGQMVYL